jgi:hypothetical protein
MRGRIAFAARLDSRLLGFHDVLLRCLRGGIRTRGQSDEPDD